MQPFNSISHIDLCLIVDAEQFEEWNSTIAIALSRHQLFPRTHLCVNVTKKWYLGIHGQLGKPAHCHCAAIPAYPASWRRYRSSGGVSKNTSS